MIQIIIFPIAISAYENHEGCSTKTFNYAEYGYTDVEDLYNQFTCEGARQGSFLTRFEIHDGVCHIDFFVGVFRSEFHRYISRNIF